MKFLYKKKKFLKISKNLKLKQTRQKIKHLLRKKNNQTLNKIKYKMFMIKFIIFKKETKSMKTNKVEKTKNLNIKLKKLKKN